MAAQQVDCLSDNFAGLSSSSIDLGVSGMTTGQRNYTVSLSSIEADADPSDNTMSAAVTVNAVSGGGTGGGGEDDGGGAASPLALWLLGWIMLVKRRRARQH